jgi:hypothetical protein
MAIASPNAASSTPYSIDDILRFTQPSKGSGFKRVLGTIAGGAGSVLGGAANLLVPGLGSLFGGKLSSGLLGAAMPGLGSETTQFLELQRQMQLETRTFETITTMLKVRHDSEMSAIRNMK